MSTRELIERGKCEIGGHSYENIYTVRAGIGYLVCDRCGMEMVDPGPADDDDDSDLDFDGDLPSVVDPSKEPTDVVPTTDDPPGGEGGG